MVGEEMAGRWRGDGGEMAGEPCSISSGSWE